MLGRGVWRTERSQPTGQNGLLLAEDSTPFGPRHSHDMLTSAWTRFERREGGMKPFARKGDRKGGPKIQSLSVSAGAYEAVPYRIRWFSSSCCFVAVTDSDSSTNEYCEWIPFLLTNLLRTSEGRREGDVMDRVMNSGSMLVANSIAFAIWGGRRDNCTRGKEGTGAFALKESARLIMCFFNEVVELFPLKRIHAETVN